MKHPLLLRCRRRFRALGVLLALGPLVVAASAQESFEQVEQPVTMAWPDERGSEVLAEYYGEQAAADSLVARWCDKLFRHPHPDDPARHRGKGLPLQGSSWRNRPFHAGWMVGTLFGDDLAGDSLQQDAGLFGGYRLGWDFDHYWGVEGRFAFANLDLQDQQDPPHPRTARDWFWDADLLYYPWGDARWRPYASLGLGLADYQFEDQAGRGVSTTTLQLPFGLGLKYYYQKWLALRVSAMDNLSFGRAGVDSMHNYSLTAGVEVHWGSRAVSYYPWNPSRFIW